MSPTPPTSRAVTRCAPPWKAQPPYPGRPHMEDQQSRLHRTRDKPSSKPSRPRNAPTRVVGKRGNAPPQTRRRVCCRSMLAGPVSCPREGVGRSRHAAGTTADAKPPPPPSGGTPPAPP
eukprot:1909465-Lingulodinium_polyedra.AAC.1